MPAARLVVDPVFTVARLNRRLFGSFVEHLGRCVYDGIYVSRGIRRLMRVGSVPT